MREITANQNLAIPLGRQGENEVVKVKFPVAGWSEIYGEGDYTLLHQRAGDAAPYPITVTREDDNIIWIVTNADVYFAGYGEAQFIYIVNNAVAKSVKYKTFVLESVDGGEIPEPTPSWIERVLEIGAEEEASQHTAEAWAVGQRGGEDVPDTDETYHNNSKWYAQEAQAAEEAIENLDVSAESLPAGSDARVTKTVDPETGAVNLEFGIPVKNPTDEQVASAVDEWLDENIAHETGYVLDRTLVMQNAAAPADLVGDQLRRINAISDEDMIAVPFTISATGTYIKYETGTTGTSANYEITDYVDVSKYKRILYKWIGLTAYSTSITSGMAFYDENKGYISGKQSSSTEVALGYYGLFEITVPPTAKYARFTVLEDTETYGDFELYGKLGLVYDFERLSKLNDSALSTRSLKSNTVISVNDSVYAPLKKLVTEYPYSSTAYTGVGVMVYDGNSYSTSLRKSGTLSSSGAEVANSTYYIVGPIYPHQYENFEEYIYIWWQNTSSGGRNFRIFSYNANGEARQLNDPSSEAYNAANQFRSYRIPHDCEYIKFSFGTASNSTRVAFKRSASSEQPENFYGGRVDWLNGKLEYLYDAEGNALETPTVVDIPKRDIWGRIHNLSVYPYKNGLSYTYTDVGSVEVEYVQDATVHFKRINGITAPVLNDFVADTSLAVGDYRIINEQLYIVTDAIASGEAIIVGTNASATTVASELSSSQKKTDPNFANNALLGYYNGIRSISRDNDFAYHYQNYFTWMLQDYLVNYYNRTTSTRLMSAFENKWRVTGGTGSTYFYNNLLATDHTVRTWNGTWTDVAPILKNTPAAFVPISLFKNSKDGNNRIRFKFMAKREKDSYNYYCYVRLVGAIEEDGVITSTAGFNYITIPNGENIIYTISIPESAFETYDKVGLFVQTNGPMNVQILFDLDSYTV